MTDLMTIHFFRKTLNKIDFNKVLEFFDSIPNFNTYYTDEEVQIEYEDKEFNFSYRYLITKKSQVRKIYNLNTMYSNINFLLEMPIVIPTFLAKEVFAITQKLCKEFEFGYYNDSFADVQAFNIVDLLVFFDKQRKAYMEENEVENKIFYENEKINAIFKYQRSIEDFKDYYNNEVNANMCYPVVDVNNNISGICYDWNLGTPIIFPPYVDFINIIDAEEGNMIIKRDDLLEILKKYLLAVETLLPDMFIIKDNKAKNCKRELKKIKKAMLTGTDFKVLRMCDVIEA